MANGYRKNGLVDLRRLPVIRTRPLFRSAALGLAHNKLFSVPGATTGQPTIDIDVGVTGRKRMEVILHEALHQACPWMVESAVRMTARYQAMVLWNQKYRDPDSQPE